MTIAAEHDVPIPYMQRTRDYYQAIGFAPYRWAHFADVPFTPLAKPLAQCRVALITTAAPFQPGVGDQGPGAKYNASAKFYTVYSDSTETIPDLRISHVGYDRAHTTADDPRRYQPDDEIETWRQRDPLPRLRRFLEHRGIWDEASERTASDEILADIDASIARAEALPEPSYASYVEAAHGRR